MEVGGWRERGRVCGFWRVVKGASGRLFSGWSLGAAGDWMVSEATEAMHASRERANDRRPGPSAGLGQREGLPEQRRLARGQHTGKPREGDGPRGGGTCSAEGLLRGEFTRQFWGRTGERTRGSPGLNGGGERQAEAKWGMRKGGSGAASSRRPIRKAESPDPCVCCSLRGARKLES